MTTAGNLFVEFLRQKNLKLTHQREDILRAFLGSGKHLSVEELYELLKKDDPTIGQATVFRTLKLLCEANIAREVGFGDKVIRYEAKIGREHHDHLVCINCGKLIEAVDPEIEKLQDKLCQKFEFQQKWHRMEIFGFCSECTK
jgi:Fur family transcriptional regulator, ferric uptake regulator